MEETQYRNLMELVVDAEACHRLTQFERGVLQTVKTGLDVYKDEAEFSEKQWRIIHEIEAKVYAT